MSEQEKLNVLLVEDDSGKLLIYQSALAKLPVNLITASSAKEALRQLLRNNVAVVLMDVGMPGIRGAGLAGIIKGNPRLDRMAIIFLSDADGDIAALQDDIAGPLDFIPLELAPYLLPPKVEAFLELYRKSHQIDLLTADLAQAKGELERRVALGAAQLEDEIAQRRKMELSLRASEERWRRMFEACVVGIAIIDHRLRFLVGNPAFQRMTGYPGVEIEALDPIMISHDEDREATRKILEDVLAGRRADYQFEQRYKRKDGTIIWVRVSATATPDPESNLPVILALVEDITEGNRVEQVLTGPPDTLLRVTRLTTMGKLVASIGHEINQPLTSIVANGDACLRLLQKSPPDVDNAREAARAILGEGKRASEVIKHIRDLARRSPPAFADIDLNEVVDDVLTLTRHELQKLRVAVSLKLDPQPAIVFANKVQLQQVVLNLVMNALEAMTAVADDLRTLIIRSRVEEMEVVVEVEDNGAGLDPQHTARLFEAFFTTKAGGLGIGLSICHSIIEAHQGHLWVDARPGRGALFCFAIPRYRSFTYGGLTQPDDSEHTGP